ncbi:MAG: type 2 GTP cyclohydrolase I [Aeromonadaceae bacterium]
MNHLQLEAVISDLLNCGRFKDYAPNGLQVEGRAEVRRVVTGVTASQALLDAAVACQADAVLVHHGYFWGNEAPSIRGMKKRRLQTLLSHDINLYAYHLPLDAHPVVGNNAQLARQLDITVTGALDPQDPCCLILGGELSQAMTGDALAQHLQQRLGREILHCGDTAPTLIRRLAWCTGGGQGYLAQAAASGVDAFITGEVSEQTIHIAREMGIHFYAAGHHATERYGIQALGHWLMQTHGLDVQFIDIPNPA